MNKLKTMMDKLGLQYKIDGCVLMLNGHGEIMKIFNDLYSYKDIGDYKGIYRGSLEEVEEEIINTRYMELLLIGDKNE